MDFKLNDDFSLAIENGDFALETEADQRHQQHLLLSGAGSLRHAPLLGVNITSHRNANIDAATAAKVRQRVRRTLEADGYRVRKVDVWASPAGDGNYQMNVQPDAQRP